MLAQAKTRPPSRSPSFSRTFSFGSLSPERQQRINPERGSTKTPRLMTQRVNEFSNKKGFFQEKNYVKYVEATFQRSLRGNAILRSAFANMWYLLDEISLSHGCVPTGLVYQFVHSLYSCSEAEELVEDLLKKFGLFFKANRIQRTNEQRRRLRKELSSFGLVYFLNVDKAEVSFTGKMVEPRVHSPSRICKMQRSTFHQSREEDPPASRSKRRGKAVQLERTSRSKQIEMRRTLQLRNSRLQKGKISAFLNRREEWKSPSRGEEAADLLSRGQYLTAFRHRRGQGYREGLQLQSYFTEGSPQPTLDSSPLKIFE